MLEIGPKHSLNYREEILSRLFDCIQSTESCFLIGAGSMGKTHLLDHLMLPSVQENYLHEAAAKTILIRMDMNRISAFDEWGIFELTLTTLLQTCGQVPELEAFAEKTIKDLLMPMLNQPNQLKVLRSLELTISNLCTQQGFRLCFVFDEFDEAYQTFPKKVFAHLRGIRDANKRRLCYALFLRNLPHRLRPSFDNESFYELISRNLIGIGPYTLTDSIEMLKQLEARHHLTIQKPHTRENFFRMSGGHPGLLQALFSLLKTISEDDPRLLDTNWLLGQDSIKDECQKLFASLTEEEQIAIADFVHGRVAALSPEVQKVLLAKGLLQLEDPTIRVFSPIFNLHLQRQP